MARGYHFRPQYLGYTRQSPNLKSAIPVESLPRTVISSAQSATLYQPPDVLTCEKLSKQF